MQVSQSVSQTYCSPLLRHLGRYSYSGQFFNDGERASAQVYAQVFNKVIRAWRFCALSLSSMNLETRDEKLFEKVFQVSNLLTLDQVASKLAISKRSVQRIIKTGQIEALHLTPGIVRVRDTALERYLDRVERAQRLSGVKHNG